MRLSIHSTVLPIAVCCSLMGFPTFQFVSKTMRGLHFVYCTTIAVSVSLLSAIYWLTNLYNCEVNLMKDTIVILVLIYYYMKFNLSQNTMNHALRNLDYVDKCFDSIGFKVWHVRDHVTCWIYLGVTLTHRMLVTYTLLWNVPQTGGHEELLPKLNSFFNTAIKFLLFYAEASLEAYFVVALYILYQRLMIFRHTVLRFNYMRNVAWCAPDDGTCRRVNIAEERELFNTLYSIYRSLIDTYVWTKRLCKHLLCFKLFLLNFSSSLYILLNEMADDNLTYIRFLIQIFTLQALPFWLATSVTSEIISNKAIILNVYYQNHFSSGHNKMKNWLRLSTNTEANFDCGFFTADCALFLFVSEFSVLFLMSTKY